MKSFTSRTGILTWDYDPPKGGMGRAMQLLSKALDPVDIFTPVIKFGGHVLFSFLLPFILQEWIDRMQIQVLILPTGPGGIFLLRKPKRCKILVVSYHTYRQQSRLVSGQWWKRFFIPLEKRTIDMADHIICYSKDTGNVLLDAYSVSGNRVSLLPQLIDTDVWKPQGDIQKEHGLCVCVARLEKRKGVEVLLKAWPKVVKSFPEAKLTIVGDGVLSGRIDQHIKNLASSVLRLPFLSQKELIDLVQSAELLVCPSYLEGFGLSAVEGMLAGTAVVASNVDGLASLIEHGETGWLVPPNDPEKLAEAIYDLLDSNKREYLEKNALLYARTQFDMAYAKKALQIVLDTL